VLRVSASGYYAWRHRQARAAQGEAPGPRAAANQALLPKIQQIHAASLGTYGSPRIHAELQANGEECSRGRVERLMRHHGIQGRCRRRRRVPVTTDANHRLPVAANVLNQEFTAAMPNEKWVADFTYIPTDQGWLYLAVVLDLFSRKVVGWAMDGSMTTQLVEQALRNALTTRRPATALLHHSDRGSQYASHAYQALLRTWQVQVSMSRSGVCYDNAVIESFFATLKVERIHGQRYRSHAEARTDVFHYIEAFYNTRRRHSALGYLSPAQFEHVHHRRLN
jgi:putative transposase